MKWTEAWKGTWIREDGRGRVSITNDEPAHLVMWYRIVPTRGQWLQVRAPGGQVTFRRSLPAAYKAVAEAIERVDSEREAA